MKIAVCIPSRGLVHSRTIEHILDNLAEVPVISKIFLTHDMPIPDCFNDLTNRALEWGAIYLWFVEEDMEFPEDTLKKLLESNAPVSTIDYPVSKNHMVVDRDDEAVNKFGTGCTLISAIVIKQVGAWRDNIVYTLPDWIPKVTKQTGYGRHDVDFAQRCKRAGVKVSVACRGNQYRLEDLGSPRTNKGVHHITLLREYA